LQQLLTLSSLQHKHQLNSLTLSTLGGVPSTQQSSSGQSVNLQDVREAIAHLQGKSQTQPISGDDILDLFTNLFGQDNWRERGLLKGTTSPAGSGSTSVDDVIIGADSKVNHAVDSGHHSKSIRSPPGPAEVNMEEWDTSPETHNEGVMTTYQTKSTGDQSHSTQKVDQMENALDMLRQVS
jgi:hypothetical protein